MFVESKNKSVLNISIVGLFFALFGLSIFCASTIIDALEFSPLTIWFCNFHYFTEQTNLICYFVLISFFLVPKHKMFKNNKFFAVATTYISVTSSIWLAVLLPGMAIAFFTGNGDASGLDALSIISNVYFHVIFPWFFIYFYWFLFRKEKYSKVVKFTRNNMIACFIYPTIYALYTIILPFVSDGMMQYAFPNYWNSLVEKPEDTYVSVYGPVTDFRSYWYVSWLTYVILPTIGYLFLRYYTKIRRDNA